MTLIKLREAVEMLEKAGILGAETKQKEQAVKRLLNQGLILGEKPPANQPKVGWQVDQDSLNQYIRIGNLKKADMVKRLIELERLVKDLEFQMVQTTDNVPLKDAIQALKGTTSATHDMEVKREVEAEKKPLQSLADVPQDDEITVSKLVIVAKESSKMYKVEFLLNKEHFEGLVSTEFNTQFIEISNAEKRFVFGENAEQSDYLEALSRKMSANLVRKIRAFDKKNGQE